MVTWYIWLSIYTNNETLCIIWNLDLSSRGFLGRIYALSIEVLLLLFAVEDVSQYWNYIISIARQFVAHYLDAVQFSVYCINN